MTGKLVRTAGLALFGISLLSPANSSAQVFGEPEAVPISFGASLDVASSYVWRGLELSDGINVQPAIWIGSGALEIGTWGSHAIEGDFHEQDFWITYYLLPSRMGSMALTVTDYYVNPDFGEDFFDFSGTGPCSAGETPFGRPGRCVGGPHTGEVMGAYSFARAPIDLSLAYNFHNDPESAFYGQAGYSPSVADFDFDFLVGAVFGESNYYYQTDGTALTNLAAGVSRTLSMFDFSLPIGIEVVHAPHFDETYYVLRGGIGLER